MGIYIVGSTAECRAYHSAIIIAVTDCFGVKGHGKGHGEAEVYINHYACQSKCHSTTRQNNE